MGNLLNRGCRRCQEACSFNLRYSINSKLDVSENRFLTKIRTRRGQETPGDALFEAQEAPGSTQEAPRRHPGGTQEAPRRHPGGTQGDPGHPGGSRKSWEQRGDKTIVIYHRKWRDRPFRVDETMRLELFFARK